MAPSAMQCECGSTFFYTARAEQFQAGGFGTAEFRSISNAPKTILVCLCGKPVTPKPSHFARGTMAGVAEQEFAKSVEAALKFRNAHSLDHVAQIAASPAELQKVQDQVDEIRKAVLALPKSKAKTKESSNDGTKASRS